MIVTPIQMQEIERAAFASGVQAADLMEEAGEGIARVIEQFFPIPGTCVVYCGKGNNAGDALVAACYLARIFHADLLWKSGSPMSASLSSKSSSGSVCSHSRRQTSSLALPHQTSQFPRHDQYEISGLAEHRWKILIRLSLPAEEMSLLAQSHLEKLLQQHRAVCVEELPEIVTYPLILLDGVLGIGAQGEPRGFLATLIQEMNEVRDERSACTVAVDIPSGLDGTTGKVAKYCVAADVTVTLAYAKTGLLTDAATDRVGRLAVVPLPDLMSRTNKEEDVLITPAVLKTLLPPRSFDAHKGMFGHLGIIAGSLGYLGAARLAATAACHAGAGLVTLYALPEIYDLLAVSVPAEVMVKPINRYTDVLSEQLNALAIGPGLGSKQHSEIVEVVESATFPCLVDADGLNAIASEMSMLSKCRGPRLLTPHPAEMQRLSARKDSLRIDWANDLVRQYPVTLLLKGARTIIAEQGKPSLYNTTGHPGMATAGMGDVLTGVAAAFLAEGYSCREAAKLGAWLCGHAAELAIYHGTASQESLTASDVIAHLGRAMRDLREGSY